MEITEYVLTLLDIDSFKPDTRGARSSHYQQSDDAIGNCSKLHYSTYSIVEDDIKLRVSNEQFKYLNLHLYTTLYHYWGPRNSLGYDHEEKWCHRQPCLSQHHLQSNILVKFCAFCIFSHCFVFNGHIFLKKLSIPNVFIVILHCLKSFLDIKIDIFWAGMWLKW